MQYGICIVNSTIYGIRVNVGKVRLILCGFVRNITFVIQFNELIFISFVFNEDRIILTVICFQNKLCIGTVATFSASKSTSANSTELLIVLP